MQKQVKNHVGKFSRKEEATTQQFPEFKCSRKLCCLSVIDAGQEIEIRIGFPVS